MPLVPRDLSKMNARELATYFAQAGIQADKTAKTFTPETWTGFSADPVGVITYYDFGTLVVLSRAVSDLTGTSDAADMAFTGLPVELRPVTASIVRSVPCITLLNGVQVASIAHIDWTGTVTFGAGDTSATAGRLTYTASYNTVGDKGLPAGWHVIYAK